jgi:hypothetical protein
MTLYPLPAAQFAHEKTPRRGAGASVEETPITPGH